MAIQTFKTGYERCKEDQMTGWDGTWKDQSTINMNFKEDQWFKETERVWKIIRL